MSRACALRVNIRSAEIHRNPRSSAARRKMGQPKDGRVLGAGYLQRKFKNVVKIVR